MFAGKCGRTSRGRRWLIAVKHSQLACRTAARGMVPSAGLSSGASWEICRFECGNRGIHRLHGDEAGRGRTRKGCAFVAWRHACPAGSLDQPGERSTQSLRPESEVAGGKVAEV